MFAKPQNVSVYVCTEAWNMTIATFKSNKSCMEWSKKFYMNMDVNAIDGSFNKVVFVLLFLLGPLACYEI